MLLLFLPLAALADGMVIPTVAYPAKITIPDQRALICYTNGTERLVIETRSPARNKFRVGRSAAQPASHRGGHHRTVSHTAIFFRPKIIHKVPHYYIGILFALGFVYLLRLAAKSV